MEKIRSDGPIHLVAPEGLGQGIVGFEDVVKLLDKASAFIDQLTASLDQASQGTSEHAVCPQGFEFVVMESDVLFQEIGVGEIALGVGDREGGTVTGQSFGIDWKDHNEVIAQERGDDRTAGGFDGQGYGLSLEARP